MEPRALLELIDESPARVADHDKAGWLALFAAGATVEDPVGTAPHTRGAGLKGDDDELGRFYETFIAPNRIHFEVIEDIVVPPEVVRDVVIHTRLASGLELEVPARLLYEVTDARGDLAILRLAAHWELRPMSMAAATAGLAGLATMTSLSLRMLGQQGIGGTLGYSRGMVSGIFGRGAEVVKRLAAAVTAGDSAALEALFADARPRIEWSRGPALTVIGFLEQLPAPFEIEVSAPISAGWVTTFRFASAGTGGMAFARFDPATGRLARLRFYLRG